MDSQYHRHPFVGSEQRTTQKGADPWSAPPSTVHPTFLSSASQNMETYAWAQHGLQSPVSALGSNMPANIYQPAPIPIHPVSAPPYYSSFPQNVSSPQNGHHHRNSSSYLGNNYDTDRHAHNRSQVLAGSFGNLSLSEAYPPAPSWDADARTAHHHVHPQGASQQYYSPPTYPGQHRDMSVPLYTASQTVAVTSPPRSSTSTRHASTSPYARINRHELPSVDSVTLQPGFQPGDPPTRVPCRWNGCTIVLDDLSIAGVKRHMRDWHPESSALARPPKERATCLWDDGGVCGRPLDIASFAKHVASVHLKSTAEECEYCHNLIGRRDSLARHKRDHCPHRPQRR